MSRNIIKQPDKQIIIERKQIKEVIIGDTFFFPKNLQ
jgi:hypothetical protein